MGSKMSRGKQQILFNYLPGKTFDFEGATIARVRTVRGALNIGGPDNQLNPVILLRKVAEDARAWRIEYRPTLRDDVLADTDRFVLLNPTSVEAEMFPKVLWCQNRRCGRVYNFEQTDYDLRPVCRACQGRLEQLRFVKIHRCGVLQPLIPPYCKRCKSANNMALDARSERISNFKWVCRTCNTSEGVYGGRCTNCTPGLWPDEGGAREMSVEVHRAGRTFYARSIVLLNIPNRGLDTFFSLPQWYAIAAAKYLRFPEVTGRQLTSFVPTGAQADTEDSGLSGGDLDTLLRRQANGEITPTQFVAEMQSLRDRRLQERQASSPLGVARSLEQRTGVPLPVWAEAGQEVLEAVMPLEAGNRQQLTEQDRPAELQGAQRVGLEDVTLLADFPIVNATYGFSRSEYAPNVCWLRPFPEEPDYGGKLPIYVDKVQADALLVRLDPVRVCRWLERNDQRVELPHGEDPEAARRAYFVRMFHEVALRQTIPRELPEARMVFGLLHTMSHLCLRQATLLCGLDRTSLSEYLLPRTLTFAIYCNHRDGATIGALTALFEQSLAEWLNAVRDARRCVYDPVCRDREASCHACTHLAETSCRAFNLNLSRTFLFGGPDPQLGSIDVGYFDPSFLA